MMGERHQIYIRLPYKFVQQVSWSSKETIENDIIALHHQWLSGFGPVTKLKQFADFFHKGKNEEFFIFTEHSYQNPQLAAQSLYNLDIENGHYYPTSILDYNITKNPKLADNDHGITVIDLKEKGILKYCFMFLHNLNPLSAKSYIDVYYPDRELLKEDLLYKESLVNYLENLSVLSSNEVRNIFPGMFLNHLLGND
jgi:hypothetical protein